MGGGIFKKYFKFAVIRNPWDRMVSWYHYLNIEDDFCRWVVSPTCRGTHVTLKRLLRPQYDYISDKQGKIIVDKIIRFQHFETEFKEICKKFKLKNEEIPWTKKAKRKPYKEYYTTPESILTVKKMFAKDIQRFGYSF